jgi:hypothetical protein
MAICEACGQEMLNAVGCTIGRITYSDGVYERVRVGRKRPRKVCGDCGAPSGSYHHPGCDMEPCPRCKGQLIMCDCGQRMWEDGVLSGGHADEL